MGTNYYHHRDVCPCCRHAAEKVHIGKSSWGWTFSFHGIPEAKSWAEWREVLAYGGEIRNEYNEVVGLADLEAMIEDKREERHNHAKLYPEGNWIDPDGHSFTGGEFS